MLTCLTHTSHKSSPQKTTHHVGCCWGILWAYFSILVDFVDLLVERSLKVDEKSQQEGRFINWIFLNFWKDV